MKHKTENIKLYIKEVMDAKKVTNVYIAEKLGITPEAVSRMKSSTNPSLSTLKKLADVLDVSVNDLVYGLSENCTDKVKSIQKYKAVGSYFPKTLELIIELREKDTNRMVVIADSWDKLKVACFERGITKEQIEIESI